MESSGTHGHSTDGQHELPQRSVSCPVPVMAAFRRKVYKSIFKGDLAGFFIDSHSHI